jgi:ADP-ribose pyrophosphatase
MEFDRRKQMENQNSEDKKATGDLKQTQDTDTLAWEEVRTEHIIQDEWIDFRKSAYRLPDGKVFEPYYTYSRRNYVVIVASDTEGRYLCVHHSGRGLGR